MRWDETARGRAERVVGALVGAAGAAAVIASAGAPVRGAGPADLVLPLVVGLLLAAAGAGLIVHAVRTSLGSRRQWERMRRLSCRRIG